MIAIDDSRGEYSSLGKEAEGGGGGGGGIWKEEVINCFCFSFADSFLT